MAAPGVIPRPRTADAARLNPGRWICTLQPGQCGGIFRVYGQDMACPLWERCREDANRYEYSLGPKVSGRYMSLDTDMEHRQRHGKRLSDLRAAFCPRRYERTDEQRERHARYVRERRRKQREAMAPPPEPERIYLPCGEDCANCPWEACRYTDEDKDSLLLADKRERERRRAADKHRRERERMASDPAYAAHMRELAQARMQRYYQSHKEILRAKARERMRSYGKRKDQGPGGSRGGGAQPGGQRGQECHHGPGGQAAGGGGLSAG